MSEWSEYQNLVLHELARLSESLEKIQVSLDDQRLVIESLKLKTSFIATIAGFISAIGFNLGKLLIER